MRESAAPRLHTRASKPWLPLSAVFLYWESMSEERPTFEEILREVQQILQAPDLNSNDVWDGAFLLVLLHVDDWSVKSLCNFMRTHKGQWLKPAVERYLERARETGIIVEQKLDIELEDWQNPDPLHSAVAFTLDVLRFQGQIQKATHQEAVDMAVIDAGHVPEIAAVGQPHDETVQEYLARGGTIKRGLYMAPIAPTGLTYAAARALMVRGFQTFTTSN